MRQRFQLRVVGGDEAGDAFLYQVEHDGAGDGRPFLGVGTSAQLIEQNQRFGAGVAQNAHDVGNVAGEGGKRLLDGLLIANIGKDVLKEADLRSRLGGDV
ncbi:hypothetical protein SDC9_101556 [bioreactor metagenome]|uniref:Uncharacterized protein n=1 Tax=bioreactor metagenome TaxID=1076179 RepID=A0A645APE4_9ZZZZ